MEGDYYDKSRNDDETDECEEYLREQSSQIAAFVSRFFMGGAITEGTIIEITITRPGEEPVSTNLKVQKSDLDLVEELKNLR